MVILKGKIKNAYEHEFEGPQITLLFSHSHSSKMGAVTINRNKLEQLYRYFKLIKSKDILSKLRSVIVGHEIAIELN